jgi:SAM-dependent methyltransferase/uncharacterized protein YbaR (Trm112 family)
MTSFENFLAVLQCPACGGDLAFVPTASGIGAGHYGILSCACSRYPVIDDVPVLMKRPVGIISHWNDGAIHSGPTAQQLVTALEGGASTEALLDCLVFPRKYPLQGRLSRAHLWPVGMSEKAGLAQTRTALRRLIAEPPGKVTARDVFRFFHSRRSGNNPFLAEYFLNRFVMPRYLSAMALVQRFPASDKPVLDIACGYGHFEHYLTRRERSTPAVGVDINFYQLWGAKKWVAPDAWFVCCDAGAGLPFKSDTFSAAICSDAFMYIPEKALVVKEVDRVAPMRPALYARVGNREVSPLNPRHGGEMRPEEYWDLFGRDRCRYFVDDALWKDYLMRRSPMSQEPAPLEDLRWEKYLTYLIHPEALSPTGEKDGIWCHGVGSLALNPVIEITEEQPDALQTEFMFRSAWGAYEDSDMMAYTERWGRVDRAEYGTALADPGSASAANLLERFVLIGVPDRYLPAEAGS